MKTRLNSTYDPKREDEIYKRWMERGYFRAFPNPDKKPYTIMIPPPNITGELHMGHALNNTIQDILIRAKRMQGFETLWMPGTDHAAIATEVKITKSLAKEGITKENLGREGFLEKVWEWRDKYGGAIVNQLKKLGCSCDWERIRFTMDKGLSEAVLEVFILLYNEGKVYRGEKLVNWCVKCRTTISDAEVEHEDREGTLYYFKYPIEGTAEYISFATSRPETMLGDTAVAVHPADERYAGYIGKTAYIPFTKRYVPIIADAYVEPEFGTGAVKITPAHDPNDFEVGERHGLLRINILNDDGSINENGGKYAGLTREAARELITNEMKELGLFIKTEKINHSIGGHDRCGEVIEPLLKLQWFVKMPELARPAIEAYTSGALQFNRERFGRVYLHWLENIKDWCISRQLWWGHRIPAYYCGGGHISVARNKPEACAVCGDRDLNQDEDTLDTWFSSALWPFSTLGWPEHTAELAYFYPTQVLVTAYEILFFWVVRMVFSGIKFMGGIPFSRVFITGMVLDSQGRKMSKSLDNGINPLECIKQYGADALRLMLVSGSALDNDTRFHWEKLDASRNFLNKLWNAARFVLMHVDGNILDDCKALKTEDRWILSKLNQLIKEVTEKLDEHELGLSSQKIVDFIWDEFCDWYLEMVKPRLYDKSEDESAVNSKKAALYTLRKVLIDSVKLLHPFTPFITEDLFLSLDGTEETLMLSAWPSYNEEINDINAEKDMEQIKEAIRGIRNIRAEKQVQPSRKITAAVLPNDDTTKKLYENSRAFLGFLTGASAFTILDGTAAPKNCVSIVVSGAVIYLPLDSLADEEKERERFNKEKQKLLQELARVEAKLNNEGFMAKAPAELIKAEKEKRKKYAAMLAKLEEGI